MPFNPFDEIRLMRDWSESITLEQIPPLVWAFKSHALHLLFGILLPCAQDVKTGSCKVLKGDGDLRLKVEQLLSELLPRDISKRCDCCQFGEVCITPESNLLLNLWCIALWCQAMECEISFLKTFCFACTSRRGCRQGKYNIFGLFESELSLYWQVWGKVAGGSFPEYLAPLSVFWQGEKKGKEKRDVPSGVAKGGEAMSL